MKWAYVPGFGEAYEVSDTGIIRSVNSEAIRADGTVRKLRPKILRPYANNTGHLYIRIGGRKQPRRMLHRIVWEAFNGPIPEGMVVRHLDGNPGNNNLQNLSIGTQVDNAHDTYSYGKKMGRGKLSAGDVHEIRSLLARGVPQAEIGKLYGVTQQSICNINTGKTFNYI